MAPEFTNMNNPNDLIDATMTFLTEQNIDNEGKFLLLLQLFF